MNVRERHDEFDSETGLILSGVHKDGIWSTNRWLWAGNIVEL